MAGLFSKGGLIGGALGFGFGGQGVIPGMFAGSGVQGILEQNAARAGFDPYSGMPLYPDYIGMEPVELNGAGLLNRAPMDKFTQEAMRSGPSREAELAVAEARRQGGLTRDQLKKQALGEAAQAKNALAMKGGLQTGAAERVNTAMGSRALELAQQAHADTNRNIASIGMEDENNRVKMLGQAPAMQLSAAEFASKDLDRKQLENSKRNAFNLGRYNSQMSAWGAGKQAEATSKAGKK